MNEQEKLEADETPQGWFYQPANIRLLIMGLVMLFSPLIRAFSAWLHGPPT